MNVKARLDNEFVRRYPNLAAQAIESLSIEEQLAELAALEPRFIVSVFDFLLPTHAGKIFEALGSKRQHQVLNASSPRLAVLLLAQLGDEDRQRVLERLGKTLRTDLERQLAFPENSAGRLMDGVFVTCRESMTVEEALNALRASTVQRARSLFVVDNSNRLTGRVDVQDLALEESETVMRKIMHPADAVLSPLDQREQIVEMLDQYRLDALPVVDSKGWLMGVVRYASLFSAIEGVAISGMQKNSLHWPFFCRWLPASPETPGPRRWPLPCAGWHYGKSGCASGARF